MANQEHEQHEAETLPFDIWYTLLQGKAREMGLEVSEDERWRKEFNDGLSPGEAILKAISEL